MAVREYPAWRWLLQYWYENSGTMDIEYDAEFQNGTVTEEKSRLLSSHAPDLQLRYADASQIERLTEADQKLYAEITYSWLITRINQIKRTYHIDYLFCVMTKEPFTEQFFLFSAADRGAVRGTSLEEVYPLGKTVSVAESQQNAMRYARKNSVHLADAGKYVDYYSYFDTIDGHSVLLGMTYNLSDLKEDVRLQTIAGTAFAMVFQIILSGLCLAILFAAVLKPLKKVQESIRLYMDKKDSDAIVNELREVRLNNEIGQLSEDVAGLSVEIDDYLNKIQNITAERERIEAELSLATRIQKAMLPGRFPPFPGYPEFDIFASMDPAREVGGDFYDFFLIDNNHLCLVMADVSGKGIPAALFMMASKIMINNNAQMGKTPSQILEDVNDALCANNPVEMFVTVWLGILEISTGRLVAANAGHEYPVIKSSDGDFELLKDKHGFVVGGLEGMKYSEYELQMQAGSKLFVYTDGVPEAVDRMNNMFGTERMLAALNEDPEADPEDILAHVRGAVDRFADQTEQSDDLTMLCITYNGVIEMDAHVLNIEAAVEKLPEVQAFVGRYLDECSCSKKARMQIDIAVEEIFVNIASYAYAPETGMASVQVDVSGDPAEVTITFTDQGTPYDPLSKEDPDVTLSAEKRQIGGLGTFMTRKFMDQMLYRYENGCNILTLKKVL